MEADDWSTHNSNDALIKSFLMSAPSSTPRRVDDGGLLILISGKMHSGKDTAARILKNLLWNEYCDFQLCTRQFARGVKETTATLTDQTYDALNTDEGKKKHCKLLRCTNGEALQKLGTAVREAFDTDVWIRKVFDDMIDAHVTIVTDCRYRNEAEAGRAREAILIRVNGDPSGMRATSKRDPNHPSETELDDYPYFDAVIDNSEKGENLLEKKIREQVLPLIGHTSGGPMSYPVRAKPRDDKVVPPAAASEMVPEADQAHIAALFGAPIRPGPTATPNVFGRFVPSPDPLEFARSMVFYMEYALATEGKKRTNLIASLRDRPDLRERLEKETGIRLHVFSRDRNDPVNHAMCVMQLESTLAVLMHHTIPRLVTRQTTIKQLVELHEQFPARNASSTNA